MPNVVAAPGQTIVEEKRTRILNGNDPEIKGPSDALEYMETLSPDQWQKGNHLVYIYRIEPAVYKAERNTPAYVDKFATPVTLEMIQREYGGGLWRIVIKRGEERVCAREYPISGAPLDLTRTNGGFMTASVRAQNAAAPASNLDATQAKLIDAATNTEAQKAQVEMVKNTATEVIAMARENAPKQTSMAEMIELAQKLQAINGGGNTSFWSNPMVISLATALATKLIDRLFIDETQKIVTLFELYQKMNGGGANVVGDWKLAAAQAVPKVAESLADALHEMRMGAEVQAGVRTAEGTASAVRMGPAAPPAQQQPPPPQPGEPPASSKVIEMQPATPEDPMQAFETKFVELLANPQVNGAQAAEILFKDFPNILAEIAQYEPALIMANAFKRPILAPQAQNPRAPQFVSDLIQWTRTRLQNPGA